jgi:hypothetical protein
VSGRAARLRRKEGKMTYKIAVNTLVKWQAEKYKAPIIIYSVPDPNEHIVRLIEISDSFIETNDVTPVNIGASSELPFKSSVILVNLNEWSRIQCGELPLPENWNLNNIELVWDTGPKKRAKFV